MISALTVLAAGCEVKQHEAKAETTANVAPAPTPAPAPVPTSVPAATKKLYMDVHELGKVTAKDVAEAHKKDLATEGKYSVDFKAYWVDEKEGKVYCLAEAPSADAMKSVHAEAHGLVPKAIMEVTGDNMSWVPAAGKKLFMDVHHLGAGKVTAEAVAEAHKKDLAVEGKYDVKYLDYWVDETTGTVMCLSEAPDADAAIKVHKEAHGLVPDSIAEVSEGR
jgi:hypothetical protein